MIWRILDGGIDKDKIGKNCSDIAEVNHALESLIISNVGDGDRNICLPWIFPEQQSNVIKKVIQKIRFPMGFSSNIQNILTKKMVLVLLRLMNGIHSLRYLFTYIISI